MPDIRLEGTGTVTEKDGNGVFVDYVRCDPNWQKPMVSNNHTEALPRGQ
jgi:hypothetical protein